MRGEDSEAVGFTCMPSWGWRRKKRSKAQSELRLGDVEGGAKPSKGSCHA